MKSRGATSSLRSGASTVRDPQVTTCYQVEKEWTGITGQRSQEPGGAAPSSGVITYRGVRGLKHKNDHLHRSATTMSAVLDRPPGQAASERQNVANQCPSSSDQRRPVHSTLSRRSASADRLTAATSTPRTLFETLYHDKV